MNKPLAKIMIDATMSSELDNFGFLCALNNMGSLLYLAYEKLADGENNVDLTNALQEAFAAGVNFARRPNHNDIQP